MPRCHSGHRYDNLRFEWLSAITAEGSNAECWLRSENLAEIKDRARHRTPLPRNADQCADSCYLRAEAGRRCRCSVSLLWLLPCWLCEASRTVSGRNPRWRIRRSRGCRCRRRCRRPMTMSASRQANSLRRGDVLSALCVARGRLRRHTWFVNSPQQERHMSEHLSGWRWRNSRLATSMKRQASQVRRGGDAAHSNHTARHECPPVPMMAAQPAMEAVALVMPNRMPA